MTHWTSAIAAALILVLSGFSYADETSAPATPVTSRATTVGGGVVNPWRSPYKTVLMDKPMTDLTQAH